MIPTRPCKITINLDALTHNVNLYRHHTSKTLFGVIKANAYGHGDVMVAKHLVSLGIDTLCVSSFDEAYHLYNHGIRSDILIFGPTDPKVIARYHQPQFIYTLSSKDYYDHLPNNLPVLRFHIEVNTGMNRLGFRTLDSIRDVLLHTSHHIEGIYTHFSSADEVGDFTSHQYNSFMKIVNTLNYPFKWVHAGNSHGALSSYTEGLNAQRIGIGLYGFIDETMYPAFSKKLQHVLRLEAMIVHIDQLKKGDPVSYNRTFIADKDMLFGTIPIGYADGINPLSHTLPLKIGDRDLPILGRITMDQTMIQVKEQDKVGDWVEIIGPHRSCDTIAHHTHTIPYVVLTQLSARVTRNYELKGALIATINHQYD